MVEFPIADFSLNEEYIKKFKIKNSNLNINSIDRLNINKVFLNKFNKLEAKNFKKYEFKFK